MNKIRAIAQVVGFVTLGLLALYGALSFLGGTGPFGLAVQADVNAPAAPAEPAAVLASTITPTMNYQGFLRNPDGSLTTGAYTITARIYNRLAVGTNLYTTTVRNVNVRDGLFNIVLGDEESPLPPEAFSDMPRFIGIDLNDGGGELIPRQRLHAVPWAMTANTANTLVDDAPAQSIQGLSVSGNASINGSLSVGDLFEMPSVGAGTYKKPIVFHRFGSLGNDVDYKTDFSTSEYVCGVVGIRFVGGDIDEYNRANEIMRAEMSDNADGFWHIIADFRTEEGEGQNTAVWVMCVDLQLADW